MADRGREWRLQHSHETKALSYGHFGTATYDSRTQTWTFLRQSYLQQDNKGGKDYSNSTGFHLVDERGPISQEITSTRPTDALNLSRLVGRTALLKQIPEAAFLSKSLFAPQVLHDVDSDRTVLGDTLALGTARVSLRKSLQHDSPSCMVLVFRAGTSGEDICLAEVGAEDIALSIEPTSEISCKIPSVALNRSSRIHLTEPVRHISSAGTLSGRFLVVRDSGTSVFELLWRQRHVTQADLNDFTLTNTTLVDYSLLLTIPSTRTGEAAHTHASFQAGSQDILAIVDVHGQWSIWEIRRKRSTSAPVPYHAILQCSKNISDAATEPNVLLADNWHRICWLPDAGGTGHRIMVCHRRFAVVFDGDGMLEGQVDMRLGPQSNETQILDVRTSIVRPYLVLALTSTRLLVFTSQGLGQQHSPKYEPLGLVCSWAHFRHGSDLGLRMSIAEFEQDICVLLYSPRSDIATMYYLRHEPLAPETVSLPAPAMFNMPTEIRNRMSSISDISLYPIDVVTDLDTPKPPYRLMKLLATTDHGTIIEAVYKYQFKQSEDGQARAEIPGLSLPYKSIVSTALVAGSDLADLEDFIVSDDEEERQRPETEDTEHHRLSVFQPLSHTRDWRAIFEYSRFLPTDYTTLPFVDSLYMAVRYFECVRLQERRQPIQVLSHLVSQHQISDVEHDSEATARWTDDFSRRDDLRLDSAGLDDLSALPSEQNLLSLYQLGLLTYVASLGEKVSDRNRVNRERVVRHIIGDVFLGNIIVRSVNTSNQLLEPTLPSSPPEPLSDDTRTTPPLPVASPSPAAEEEPTVTRLRSYVSFREKVSPFQASDQENISNILAHLPDSIDEDPANYSYQNTNQRLKLVQEEVAAQSLDPKERRKAARQAARLQKKLEKSVRLGQEVMSQRNVLPGVNTFGRGVGMPGREVQSSQPGVGGFSQGHSQSQGIPGLTMTQPERGAFGTRPSKLKSKGKDKGSKRKAGF